MQKDYGPQLPEKITFNTPHHAVLIHPGWQMVADVSIPRLRDDLLGNWQADAMHWLIGGFKSTMEWRKDHMVCIRDNSWSAFSFSLQGYPRPIRGAALIVGWKRDNYESATLTAEQIQPLVEFLPPDIAVLSTTGKFSKDS